MTGQPTTQERVARLRRYLQLDPRNEPLRAELFDALLAAGDFEAAAREAADALAAHPGDPGWTHRRGVLLLATDRSPEAQRVFEGLLAEGHDDPVIRHNLAYALFAQGRYEAARDTVAPLLELTHEAAAIAWPLWLRCQHHLYELQGALKRVLEVLPSGVLSAEALGVASVLAIDAEALELASAWSTRALRDRPDQLEALVASGTVALAGATPSAASGLFEHAIQVNPRDGRSWSGLAMARMVVGELGEASRAFRKAVAFMPGHVGTWIAFGWCQVLTKDPEAALQSFEAALALDGNFGESHGAAAVALARLGRVADAKREIEIALRLDPEGMSARYAMAVLAGKADDPEAVRRLARRAMARMPRPAAGPAA